MPDFSSSGIDSFAEPVLNRTERIDYISGEYLQEVEVLARQVTGSLDTTSNTTGFSNNKSLAINGEVEIELSYLTNNVSVPSFGGTYDTNVSVLEVVTNAKSVYPAGTTTTEYGSELVTNTTFLGLSNWQAFSATLEVGGIMTQLGDYPAFQPRVNQVIDTTIGQKYRIRVRANTNSKELNIRAVNNGGSFETLGDTFMTNVSGGSVDLFFIATSDSTAISLRGRGDSGDVFILQEVNCISVTSTTYVSDTTDIVSTSKAYVVLNGYLDKRVDSYTLDNSILRSSDVIYIKEGEKVYLPTYNTSAFAEDITITKDSDVTVVSTGIASDTSDIIEYIEINTNTYDNVSISSTSGRNIVIKQLDKCDDIKLTFVNKYGVLEDVWMAGSVVENMSVTNNDFKGKSIQSGVFNPTIHEKVDLNRQGKGNYILNSGFYSEDYNKVFEQLMLSRSVWLTYNGLVIPVNIINSSLVYKNNYYDKLISYTINLESASGTINKMR